MGEIYDVRSAVEHLNDNRYLEEFDRDIRLDIVKKEAIVEAIARTAIARIISDCQLWPHFACSSGLLAFWSLTLDEKRCIWGLPIDPLAALVDFEPQFINDGVLGGP